MRTSANCKVLASTPCRAPIRWATTIANAERVGWAKTVTSTSTIVLDSVNMAPPVSIWSTIIIAPVNLDIPVSSSRTLHFCGEIKYHEGIKKKLSSTTALAWKSSSISSAFATPLTYLSNRPENSGRDRKNAKKNVDVETSISYVHQQRDNVYNVRSS